MRSLEISQVGLNATDRKSICKTAFLIFLAACDIFVNLLLGHNMLVTEFENKQEDEYSLGIFKGQE